MSLKNVCRLLMPINSKFNSHTFTRIRCYGRWMHRNPGKVILPFETTSKSNLKKEKVIDLTPEHKKTYEKQAEQANPNIIASKKSVIKNTDTLIDGKAIKAQREEKEKKRNFYLSQTKVFDDNGNVIYEKLNENDSKISSLLIKTKSKKDRIRNNHILVESWRLIVDGLQSNCDLKYVIFSNIDELNNLRPFLPRTGVKIYKMPYKEMQMWSDVETSPGLLGIFSIPKAENIKINKPLPLRFLCDNVRVPGNLGAILRVAMGVGCEKVLLSKGCVDVWDPKVIRSAGGAHFKLPIHYSLDWEEMPQYLDENTSIFIADSNCKFVDDVPQESEFDGFQIPVLPYYGIEYATLNNITLVIGGETEGISENSYRLAASKNGMRLNIPLRSGVDSLNTGMATAVIAFEIRKQLIQTWTRLKLEKQAC